MPASATDVPTSSRRRLNAKTIVICVAVALVAAVVSGIVVADLFGDDGSNAKGQLVAAEAAPTLAFTRFDGTTTSMAEYRGQKLVVNFFSSTCVPCKREMPDFERVAREAGDEITFIGIDVQDGEAEGRAFVAKTGVTYDIGRDPTGELFNEFGGTVLPFTAFVAADGTVLERRSGRLTGADLRTRISANLLGGG